MSDMIELFRFHKEIRQERRRDKLAAADPTGWTKHTPYHWSRSLAGRKLDYWPSTGRWQWDGRRQKQSDMNLFIAEKTAARKEPS